MPYGTIKVDNVTFTNAGVDQNVTVSGLYASTTSNLNVTGTISGSVVIGSTTVSGATVSGITFTGTTVNSATGNFVTVSGATVNAVTISGTTVTGTSANFTSGRFTVLSGATISGGVATLTSGVFASGTAAAPPVSIGTTTNGLYSPATNTVAIATNGTEKARITSAGQALFGTASSITGITFASNVQSNAFYAYSASFFGNSSSSSHYWFLKSRGDTVNTYTGVQGGDVLGRLSWAGTDGTQFQYSALIQAYVDLPTSQVVASGQCPSAISFLTTTGGPASLFERMRLNKSGYLAVGFGEASAPLHVYGDIAGGSPATTGGYGSDPNVVTRFQGGSVAMDIGGLTNGTQWIQPRFINDFSTNFNLLLCPNGGNIGVGTQAPNFNAAVGRTIHIHDTRTSGNTWSVLRCSNGETGSGGANGYFTGLVGKDAYVFNYENGPLYLGTNSNVRATITSGGLVGIGTISNDPSWRVTVDGRVRAIANTFAFSARDGGAGQTSIGITRESGGVDAKTWEFLQGTGGEFLLRTINDGYTASDTVLQAGRAAATGVSTDYIFLAAGNSERLRATTSGVSIGTPIPTNASFHVLGNNTNTCLLENSNTAQFASARLHLKGGTATQAVTSLVHGNNTSGGTQTYFAIEAKNAAQTYIGTIAYFDYNAFQWQFSAGSGYLERARINTSGYFKASNSTAGYINGAGAYHELNQFNNEVGVYMWANAGTYTATIQANVCQLAASSGYSFFRGWSSGLGDTEFNLRGDGTGLCDGSWTGGGADYAEFFEWEDGNYSLEDRRGFSVVLTGNKIRAALQGEEPIGVISANPSVVGDSAWNKWSEKYLKDDFGSYIMEDHDSISWVEEIIDQRGNKSEKPHNYESHTIPSDVVIPPDAVIKSHDDNGMKLQHRKLNPAFDPDLEYIPREDRPEWACVGLLGKLRVRKGQPVGSRWIKMRDVSSEVEEWLVR
jgi:hypothetical protein